jgi:hypothetical protein
MKMQQNLPVAKSRLLGSHPFSIHTWLLVTSLSYLSMAGIIGQLTANARKRKDAKTISSDKSTYHIPEFNPNGFNPMVHNSYVRNHARIAAQMDNNNVEYMEVCKVERVLEYFLL